MKQLLPNLQALILSYKTTTANKVAKILLRKSLKISSAESCTGGLISSRLTDIEGSSAFVTLNLVTYSNEAKVRFLNVSEETIEKYGAVSSQCAYEMAKGLRELTGNDIVICTTGVAGPASSENKPVGLVYIACGYNNNITVKEFKFDPKIKRKNMKFMFSEEALKLVYQTIK